MMILEYLDTILSVHPIEVILESTSGEIPTWSPREGALSLANVPVKYNLIDLGEMIILAYRQTVPVDLWLGTM